MAPVLGYWKLRGLGQPIRFLLEYVGDEYHERIYTVSGCVPNISKDDWLKEKFSLGLDFPNLPYLIDGDLKISQTVAILRYLARKHNLSGKPEDAPKIDMVEQQLMEMRLACGRLCYSGDYDNLIGDFLKTTMADYLKGVSTFLGNKQFLFGEVTYVDFMLYEILALVGLMGVNLSTYPNLQKLKGSLDSHPRIKAYMNSDRAIKYPYHLPIAKFG